MSQATTVKTRRAQRLAHARSGRGRSLAPPPAGRRPRASCAARGRRRPARPAATRSATMRGRVLARRVGPVARAVGRVDLDAAGGRQLRRACPAATSSPRAMIATRSQTSSTSESRWLLSSTATPLRAQLARARRGRGCARRGRARWSARRAAGSAAVPIIAWARPSRCCMPLDIVPTRRSASPGRPTRSSSSERSAAPPAERWRGPGGGSSTSSAVAQSGKRNSSAR